MFEELYSTKLAVVKTSYKLPLFGRVDQALREADAQLALTVAEGRQDSTLLPKRKPLYGIAGNPVAGSRVLLNESVEALLSRVPAATRQVSISLRESAILEDAFRGQSEALSHSMWMFSGLVGFLKRDGYVPSDPALFDNLITSVSMGLAHQANIAAGCTTFVGRKRRDLYLSHLPPPLPQHS